MEKNKSKWRGSRSRQASPDPPVQAGQAADAASGQAVQPAVRLLGQCHGHNFLPNGKTCEHCLQRPYCSLNNVFVSVDDQNWSRAVFCRQPWQLCHIFGLSARGDQLDSLHTLQNGRLSARGYFTLPSFDPTQWPTETGNHQG